MWTLRKKIPAKKGSWWLTELKLKNKQTHKKTKIEPSSGFYIGSLTQASLQGEACTVFLFEPALTKEILESHFNQWDWDFPCPIRAVQGYSTPISIFFTSNLEQLYADQLGKCYLDQSNCEDSKCSFPQKRNNQGLRTGTLFYISQLCFCHKEHTFSFHQRLYFSGWSWNTRVGTITPKLLRPSCLAPAVLTELFHSLAVPHLRYLTG